MVASRGKSRMHGKSGGAKEHIPGGGGHGTKGGKAGRGYKMKVGKSKKGRM